LRITKWALFGTVITIALMYVVAIVVNSIGSVARVRWLAPFLAWSVAILFVSVLVLLTTSYAFGIPKTLSDRLFPTGPSETEKQQRAIGTREKPPQPEEERVLHGEVRDEQGKGIPGVNISVVGGNEKTESDKKGSFTLKVGQGTDGQVRLKASRDGYGTREDYFQISDMAIIQLNKTGK
jgi:membrane protein implicated in regulation of membrane protease activity